VRETVRARLQVMVKTLLKHHKYPPDKPVLRQAESLSADWVAH
jgi:type I restriction enzyme R subunit